MGLLANLTPSLIEHYTKHLNEAQKADLYRNIQDLVKLKKHRQFFETFPDVGEFRRELYPKHMNFIKLGATHRERCFMAANRIGKTMLGGYETTAHATGEYPPTWDGKKFLKPTNIWIGGDTTQTVRDIIQYKLLGPPGEHGTGMIPKENIISVKPKRNLPDAVEQIHVRHISGGTSVITLKTYEQGRETWQGTEVDIIWLDEEPPEDIYAEALIRTMTTGGIVMLTFTPLRGMSSVVTKFLDEDKKKNADALAGTSKEVRSSKALVMATWDDVPHLTEEAKKDMLDAIPPNQRKARSEGIPVIGAGLIYPIDEDTNIVKDFPIPKHYKKCYGMDVGWNVTAALWAAHDLESDTVYIYSEYYGQQQEPPVHANAIKARGSWIPGVIDPASDKARSQIDGQMLFKMYSSPEDRGGMGLKLEKAVNAVEAGIYEVWLRMSTGRIKIFKSCVNLLREISMYHRDEDGKIVKKNDHLCDCLRYLVMSGLEIAAYDTKSMPKQRRQAPINYAAWT